MEKSMSENAMVVMNQIMLELQQWINLTYQPEFEIRESDYFRWLNYSRQLNAFYEPEVKLFKQTFEQLIFSMRSQKVFLFGTLYVCPTMNVKRAYEELAKINMRFISNI